MKTEASTLCGTEVLNGIYGRIADYSLSPALFVSLYQKENESFRRISLYVLFDPLERWHYVPCLKFTRSGGSSPEVLHHLRHIFYKHQTEDKSKVIFNDNKGNKCILFLGMSKDVLIAVEDSDCEPGVVMSFEENHPLFPDLLLLCSLIKGENDKGYRKDPLHNQNMQESLQSVDLFP